MPEHNHNSIQTGSSGATKALWYALLINASFLLIEFIGGLITNSLALLADAGHMLTDVAALAIALIASKVAQRVSTKTRTYGYGRVKVLAALFNGLTLWLIVGVIVWEAIHRLTNPPEIRAAEMLVIAFAGLLANTASAWLLRNYRKDDINIRGAFLHLIADSLGSLAVILAGLAMLFQGWYIVDPIVSVIISFLILWSSLGIVKESVGILLESTPEHIDLNEAKALLESFEEVTLCHDLHIWLIGSEEPILTAHIVVKEGTPHDDLIEKAALALKERFNIAHSTLQLESRNIHPNVGCNN